MPKKIYALVPSEREKECAHDGGFRYTGTVPCTGRMVCVMCGTEETDATAGGPGR